MKAKTAALALAMTAAVGCTPTLLALRRSQSTSAASVGSEAKGKVIAPKRCEMRFVLLSSPLNDAVLNDSVWSASDEQAIDAEARQALQANGLRVGVISSTLPAQVQALINAPPPHEVQPTQIILPNGENTLLTLSPTLPKLSLLLNRDGRVSGKDYTDVSGYMRLTTSYSGQEGVSLRLVPELHHGPMQHGFAPDQASSPFAVQQFVMKEGQQEDTLRELAATITLEPGQVAVIGCLPDHERSLGYFMMTAPEANSDRLVQKVALIWASRTTSDTFAASSTNPVKPKTVSIADKSQTKARANAPASAPESAEATARPAR